MYAGTKVNWHEVLLPESTVENNESLPLFLCAFSADKGTEAITDLTYTDFVAMYGSNPDFFKYGQPLIQAHKILAAGGRILGKRIVADDATLANVIITAEITTSESGTVVKYAKNSVENATSFKDVSAAADKLLGEGKYPLFVICDNGRGASTKSVKITSSFDVSKSLTYVLYNIIDIEGTNTIESTRFAVYPDAIFSYSGTKKNMALHKNTTTQFNAEYHKKGLDAFVAKLAEETGYSVDDIYTFDVLFAKSHKGEALSAWSIDSTGLDLSAEYGITLEGGSDGAFVDGPFPGSDEPIEAWTKKAVEFFDGTFSDEIYDLDQHKIDFCVDANYPTDVKKAIATLADFRQDFFYFRDMNLAINTVSDVQDKVSDVDWDNSPYIGDYMSHYDVIDDTSKKQITVTMCYGLAPLLVNHYTNNVSAPIAGEFNNFVISDFVDGTLNVIPRITPKVDQKTLLDDLHVNYLNYSSTNLLAIQSTYTSQDHWGPLSYASNVIVTQMCIKAIRRYTPKIRFMLMEGSDFTKYRQLIYDNVIAYYAGYFKSVSLIYTADDEMTAQKIFNASLYCYYKDFPQGEIFDVFAIEGSPETNPM